MPSLPSGSVTFLFTDVEGSTRLFHRLGDLFPAVLEDHRRILRQAFTAHGGHEVKTEGDGFFVAFADPAEALAACLDAQRGLAAHPWPADCPIRVRMGIHTGDATPTEDADYLGIPVHQAARISAVGHGGQVLVSEQTASLIGNRLPDGATLTDLGGYRLKDFKDAERIYQLTHPAVTEAFPALRAAPALAHNFPDVRTTFIGRERELEELQGLVSTARLVTIVGPGGVGKTRLALEAAARQAPRLTGGARLVDLAPLADPELVAPTAAAAFGVREQPGADVALVLAEELGRTETLLVLDNCEHVLRASAGLVDTLLSRCPSLRVLATSREPLGVAGEQVWRIASLPVPPVGGDPLELMGIDSVRLFSDRAGLADARFRVSSENAAAVAAICRTLDGIPLALELVAARVAVMAPDGLARRLVDRPDLVASGTRPSSDRHQTLDATIDWSYRLLDGSEQRLFNRLSVFAGGFALEAAEEVCQEPAVDALLLLAGLVDKSLVVRDAETDRYRLLETIRQFARRRLEEAGEAEDVRTRHLRWAAALAELAEPELRTADQARWLDLLDDELANFRAAIAWALAGHEPIEGLRLAGSLNNYWMNRGFYVEGREWCERLLDAASDAPALLRGRALRVAADCSWRRNEFERALADGERALAALREAGEPRWIVAALNTMGGVTYAMEDAPASLQHHREMIELARSTGDDNALAVGLSNTGEIMRGLGDFQGARRHMEEALVAARRVRTPSVLGGTLCDLGYVLLEIGDLESARTSFRESLEVMTETRSTTNVTWVLDGLARLWERLDRPELAARLLGASEALRAKAGLLLDPPERRQMDEARARIVSRLGAERTQELVDEANHLSIEAAVRMGIDATREPEAT